MKRQGRQKEGFGARRDHRGRRRPARSQTRRELAAGDAHPGQQTGLLLGGEHQDSAQIRFRGGARIVALEALDVEKGESLGAVFDPRREGLGDVEQRFLGGALTFRIARS